MSRNVVHPGDRFDRLTVISVGDPVGSHRRVEVRCDCGTTKSVLQNNLQRGLTRSCSCLGIKARRENGSRSRTHGKSHSREYFSWQAMIQRCHWPQAENYSCYGGRGIAVCDRWRVFAEFFADMGPRPAGTTLDRINTDGHYEPENCRWASAKAQAENRRGTRWIEIYGERKTVTEWATASGLSDTAILYRLRRGITGQALLAPSRRGRKLGGGAA